MATTAELRGRVTLDGSPFRRELAQIRRSAASFGREVGPSFAAIGPKIAQVTAMVAGLGAALIGIGVKKNFDLESLQVQFEGLLGSAEAATKRMDELKQFAAATHFALGDLAEANKLLEAVGQGGMENMRIVGDAAAQTGNSLTEVAKIVQKAFVKTSSGTALGEVIDQLAERGLLAADAIAELKKQSAGGFSNAQSMKLILDQLNNAEGAMKRLSATGAGLFSTLKDNAGFALAEITKGFADASKGGIQVMIDKIQELSDDGTFQRWGAAISNSIKSIIGAWRALSDAQKTSLTNLAKGAGMFAIAWKAGLVQPLLAITAALVARMATLLSPQIILGGLVGIPAFLTGLGIGRAIEKEFDFSSTLLKFAAWGRALVNKAVAVVAAIVSPFVNLGQAIAAAMSGDATAAEQFAQMALDIKGKAGLLTGALDKIEADYQADLEDIASVSAPPMDFDAKRFIATALAEIGNAFQETGDLAEAKAKELAARLAKQFGITDMGDALGQFIENYKNAPIGDGPIDQIGNGADRSKAKVEALEAAIKRAKGGGGVFRGGNIANFDIGAQIAGNNQRFGGAAGLKQEFQGGLRGGLPINQMLPEAGAAAGARRLSADFGRPAIPIAGKMEKITSDALKVNQQQLAELKRIASKESTGSWY